MRDDWHWDGQPEGFGPMIGVAVCVVFGLVSLVGWGYFIRWLWG